MEADGLKSPLAAKSSLFAISKSILAKFNLGFIWSEITEAVLKLVGVLKLGINERLISFGLIQVPIEWLLYSSFSVVLALVHLYTLFMIVPIFNSMLRIDKEVIEAAYDSGANQFQIITNVIIPLCKPGIIIGSIFVITVVMGDFLTIGIMGGQQLASIGKIINTEMNYLQLPGAAANSVILLLITIFIIIVMTKFIDIRKEL